MLYHHHQPETEAEANRGLVRFVDRENARDHRAQPHSQVEDWLEYQPEGVRAMCAWNPFRFTAVATRPFDGPDRFEELSFATPLKNVRRSRTSRGCRSGSLMPTTSSSSPTCSPAR